MNTFQIVTATAVSLFVSSALAAQESVTVGAKPTYTFQQSPMFGGGVKSLADLRGRPTMIEFWGVN